MSWLLEHVFGRSRLPGTRYRVEEELVETSDSAYAFLSLSINPNRRKLNKKHSKPVKRVSLSYTIFW